LKIARPLLPLLLFALACFSAAQTPKTQLKGLNDDFVENKGQWDSHVQFLLQRPGLNFWLTKDGAVIDLHKVSNGKLKGDVVRLRFGNAQTSIASGLRQEKGDFNYLLGKDPSKWRTHVHRYAEVSTSEIYKGVFVRYYLDKGLPRYDLLVKPGADLSQVAMKFDGAKGVHVASNGNLLVKTSQGTLEERGLLAYQQIGSKRVQVACHIAAKNGAATFIAGNYDRSRELVIDPLIFSSYFYPLNSDNQSSTCVAETSNGNIAIATSQSSSPSFPVTLGSYQTKFYGDLDTVLAVIDSTTGHIDFATYFAGAPYQFENMPTAMKLDSHGNFAITGIGNVPTVNAGTFWNASAPQNTTSAIFLTLLSADGTALLHSASLGPGTPAALTLDPSDNIWLTGQTQNALYPTTTGPSYVAGDAFLTEVNWDFQTLRSSQYINETGGVSGITCVPTGIALDSKGGIYVAGTDEYQNTPAVPQATAGSAFTSGNAFLAHVAPNTLQVTAATDLPLHLTSNYSMMPVGLAINASDEPVVAFTATGAISTSAGAFQATAKNSQSAIYVAVLSSDLKQVLAASYLSGSAAPPLPHGAKAAETFKSLAVDSQGDVLVTGETLSFDFPTTSGAALSQIPADADTPYAFVSKFNPSLTGLDFSTVLDSGNILAQALTAGDNLLLASNKSDLEFFNTRISYMNSDPNGWGSTVESVSPTPGPTVVLSAPSVIGGQTVKGTITLPEAAPASGVAVYVTARSSSYYQYTGTAPTVASLPQWVTVTPGAKTASFSFVAPPTAYLYNCNVIFQFPTSYQSAVVAVLPPQIQSVTTNPAIFQSGTPTTVTVSLNGPAPANFAVDVPNDNVMQRINFTTGSTSGSCVYNTTVEKANNSFAVQASTDPWEEIGGSNYTFYLNETATNWWFAMNSSSVVAGNVASGAITLLKPAATAETFSLAVDQPQFAKVPGTLTVPAGTTSLTVSVSTFGVAQTKTVYVSATYNGSTQYFPITINPASLASIQTAAPTVADNAYQYCEVTLNGWAGTPAASVTVTSSNPSVLTVPASVIIEPNTGARFFPVVGVAASSTPVTITVTYGGISKAATITVTKPVGASSLKFSASRVAGGQSIIGTVTVPQIMKTATVVTLTATNAAIGNVPATVTVPAGATSVLFKVTPNEPKVSTPISVTASLNGANATGTFTVTP
jgi:hypothetical protein